MAARIGAQLAEVDAATERPSKITLIALARILGPMTAKNTLTMARRTTATIRGASGRRWPNSRRRDPRKSLAFCGGRAMPIPNMPGPPRPPGRPPGPPGAPVPPAAPLPPAGR
jgi:hypothetical protein